MRGCNLLPIRRWTDEDDAQLRSMIADGKGYADITEALGRTYNAARVRVHGLGLRIQESARKPSMFEDTSWRDRPEYRRRMSEAGKRGWSPERRKAASATAKARKLWEHGTAKLATDPVAQKARADANRAKRDKRMAWCPKHLWKDYYALVRVVGTPEARRVMGEEIVRQAKPVQPARRAHSTFEERLEAVRAGTATIYERPRIAPLQEGAR